MKKNSTPRFYIALFISIVSISASHAQFVGIGTTAPDYKLHVAGNTAAILKVENTSALAINIPTDLMFKTGTHYTGAIKTIGTGTNSARLGFFTYAAQNQSQLIERMSITDGGSIGIGTTTPQSLLDVNGRIRVRHNGATPGILFTDAAGINNRGLVGMKDDNTLGLQGLAGAGWSLMMNCITGDITMVNHFYVENDDFTSAQFTNFSSQEYASAVKAHAITTAGRGIGVEAWGGLYGVYGLAGVTGTGHRYGVWGSGNNGTGNNYGVYAIGNGGNNAFGIYATASSGSTNWGGYFSGSVYTSGSYQGSDRKLKNDIRPLDHAIQLIQSLKPSIYTYKTEEFHHMQLPQGQQYGLIADEVKQVFPDMVKKAVQPAMYENDDDRSGRMLADEVTFDAVNYTAMIPVLIAAMQEQQAMIDAQQKKIAELEARL
jgi:hypothetical protein